MEKYIKSENLKVFPSSRRTARLNKRLITEEDLISIIYQIVDVDCFVISKQFVADKQFDFDIHGYYFSILPAINIIKPFKVATNLYAYIKLDDSKSSPTLLGQDDEGIYNGLTITDTPPKYDENIYCLRILTRPTSNGIWQIPKESKIKFGTSSIGKDE